MHFFHGRIVFPSGVAADDLDKALDQESAYYHHYIGKGMQQPDAYAKVLKRFPDAVFSSYTYPKVRFVSTLQQHCNVTQTMLNITSCAASP